MEERELPTGRIFDPILGSDRPLFLDFLGLSLNKSE